MFGSGKSLIFPTTTFEAGAIENCQNWLVLAVLFADLGKSVTLSGNGNKCVFKPLRFNPWERIDSLFIRLMRKGFAGFSRVNSSSILIERRSREKIFAFLPIRAEIFETQFYYLSFFILTALWECSLSIEWFYYKNLIILFETKNFWLF